MTSDVSKVPTRAVLTRIPDSWAWMAPDLLRRLLPFGLLVAVVEIGWRPPWLGLSPGRVGAQLVFALIAAPLLLRPPPLVHLALRGARGGLAVPPAGGAPGFQPGSLPANA